MDVLEHQLLANYNRAIESSLETIRSSLVPAKEVYDEAGSIIELLNTPVTCLETIIDFHQYGKARRENWDSRISEMEEILAGVEKQGVPFLETPPQPRDTLL
jgi:hypothetical protein